MKHQGLLTIQENLQLAICFFFVAINSGEIPASVWQEKRSFEVLKRCFVRTCPTSFLLCYGKAAVLWKSCRIIFNTLEIQTQLVSDIRSAGHNSLKLVQLSMNIIKKNANRRIAFLDKSTKNIGYFGSLLPRATPAKILAASTRVCRTRWSNLF